MVARITLFIKVVEVNVHIQGVSTENMEINKQKIIINKVFKIGTGRKMLPCLLNFTKKRRK